jgi:hypothetical protein
MISLSLSHFYFFFFFLSFTHTLPCQLNEATCENIDKTKGKIEITRGSACFAQPRSRPQEAHQVPNKTGLTSFVSLIFLDTFSCFSLHLAPCSSRNGIKAWHAGRNTPSHSLFLFVFFYLSQQSHSHTLSLSFSAVSLSLTAQERPTVLLTQ